MILTPLQEAPVTTKLITGDELLEMGDLGPCELVKGRIVPVSTTGGEHGLLEIEIMRHLGNFNAGHKLGWVLGGEAGVYTRRNPDTVRGMDGATAPTTLTKLTADAVLRGEGVLNGFELPLAVLFAEMEA